MQFLQVLPMLRQAMPLPSQNPVLMARAVWRETLRVFNVEQQQAFIGSPAEDLQAQQQAQVMAMLAPMLQGMGGPPGMPGQPPMGPGGPMGAPPMGGPPAPPMGAPGLPPSV
jgi:hypothetical protein